MPSTSVILKRAKALIDTPEKLSKYSYAKDKNGYNCSGTSKKAVAFCMHGAIFRACMGLPRQVERDAEDALAEANELTLLKITAFSDTHTHDEIMQAYDKAIAYALKQQGGVEEDEAAPDIQFEDETDPVQEETTTETPPEPTKKPRKPRTKKEPISSPTVEKTPEIAPKGATDVQVQPLSIPKELPIMVQPEITIPGLGEFFV